MFVVGVYAVGIGILRLGTEGVLTTVWRAVFDGIVILSLAPPLGDTKLRIAVTVRMSALRDGIGHGYLVLIAEMT